MVTHFTNTIYSSIILCTVLPSYSCSHVDILTIATHGHCAIMGVALIEWVWCPGSSVTTFYCTWLCVHACTLLTTQICTALDNKRWSFMIRGFSGGRATCILANACMQGI